MRRQFVIGVGMALAAFHSATAAAQPKTGSLKPATQLKTPPGLASEVGEAAVLPKSAWDQFSKAKPGDYYEIETVIDGTKSTARTVIFDLADRAVMETIETKLIINDMPFTTKLGIKLAFTGPEPPADPKVKKIPDARKFKIGAREIAADTRSEYLVEGTPYKAWTSKQLLPGVSLLVESSDGKYRAQLVKMGSE